VVLDGMRYSASTRTAACSNAAAALRGCGTAWGLFGGPGLLLLEVGDVRLLLILDRAPGRPQSAPISNSSATTSATG